LVRAIDYPTASQAQLAEALRAASQESPDWSVGVCPSPPAWEAEHTEQTLELQTLLTDHGGVAVFGPRELFAMYPVDEYAESRADSQSTSPYYRSFYVALGTYLV